MVKSVFEGVVVEGDLRERISAPVKQGDALFKVARLDTLYAEAEVPERDVKEILQSAKGEIAFVHAAKYPRFDPNHRARRGDEGRKWFFLVRMNRTAARNPGGAQE